MPKPTNRVFLSHQQVADIAEAAAQVDVKNPMVSKLHHPLSSQYTGLRANEALALRIGDLDFTRMPYIGNEDDHC